MWEGLSLPHDTKFGNCRGEIVDRRIIFIWSLIHGSGWSGLIIEEPAWNRTDITRISVIPVQLWRVKRKVLSVEYWYQWHVICFKEKKRVEYLKELPAKLKLFEDFLSDKPFSAGQKVINVSEVMSHERFNLTTGKCSVNS